MNINRPKYENINYIENAFPVFRNYILKSKLTDDNFRAGFMQMLFYVVNEIYYNFTVKKYQ